MNYKVEIDSNSIREFGNDIVKEGNNFIKILDKLANEVGKMESFVSTPTMKLMNEKLSEYLSFSKNLVNDKYANYSSTMERIANIYDQTSENIRKSVDV